MKISIINGPNLNLLGTRNPDIYGSTTLSDLQNKIVDKLKDSSYAPVFFQSNVEGELVNEIQSRALDCCAIILNAGAYTHTSIAIRDAISSIKVPVIEVHISNVYAREDFRHFSHISPVASGIIVGFGISSYLIALDSILNNFVKKTNN